MKVAIFGSRNSKIDRITRMFEILNKHEVEIAIQDNFYKHIKSLGIKNNINETIKDDNFDADMAISVGGDGTFLRTALKVGQKDIPIFGINAGRLGFLADVGDTELEIALEDIVYGKYRIEKRSLLNLSTENKCFSGFNCALNEIAILKQDTASMITIHAIVNGDYLNSYEADGLIIATPTGSTAYSMSVGGPILTPTSSNFVISPIAPHSLTTRPLVVDDDCEITLDVASRSGSFLISLDGRSEICPVGTRLTISKAEYSLKVVKRLNQTFFNTLREKLMWGADSRNMY